MKFDDNLGICTKDKNKKVLYQNEICINACGDLAGETCTKGCMSHYDSSLPSHIGDGMTLVKNIQGENGFKLDAVVINDGKTLTTIQYMLNEKIDDIESFTEYFKQCGLTPSEVKIFKLVMAGNKNSEILKLLFISKATLKTHLNNIYKKLPEKWHRYKSR